MYVCLRCGVQSERPEDGTCWGTDLPHRFAKAGRKYRCKDCGLVWDHPVFSRCPVRYGLSDPYHVFVVWEEPRSRRREKG